MRGRLLFISVTILLSSLFAFNYTLPNTVPYKMQASFSDSFVLEVFVNKCNACHLQKKQVVFTSENLAPYYLLIAEQVLIMQRMPKGKKEPLPTAEKQLISAWIDVQK